MARGINCCYGCTEETGRHLGCHENCKKYNEAKAKYEAEKKLIRDNKKVDTMFACIGYDRKCASL